MQEYEIRFWLPRPRGEVFEFFSDVRNLDRMTPGWLRFEVLTPLPVELAEGVEIDYRLRWRSLPMPWRSRITDWRPPEVFTYEQARGPYRRWLHEHRYREQDGGTLVVDRVEWSVWGETLLGSRVATDVRRIFEHRAEVVRRLLDPDPQDQP